MRILLVTETLVAGGAETFVIRLANAVCATNEVMIAVMHGEMTNPALAAKVDPRVRLVELRLPAKRLWFAADGQARRLGLDLSAVRSAQRRWLARLIRETRPDIAHSHLLKADRLVTEARGVRPAMRHVLTMHGDYAPFLSGEVDPQMLRLSHWAGAILKRADQIVAICAEHYDFIRDQFSGELPKAALIYNGFEPWRRPPVPPPRPARPTRFCMASRGVRLKGWAKAIAAFGRLQPGAAELILVGEGEHLAELRGAPLPPGVKFVGFSDNPVDWIAQSDICLLPSEFPHESLPTAIMEYLYCGKPVIATDVGEIGAMIAAPSGDLAGTLLAFEQRRVSTDELAAAMSAYVDDPALGHRHAGLAPAAFAKFDMTACAAAYARVYAEISSSTAASH